MIYKYKMVWAWKLNFAQVIQYGVWSSVMITYIWICNRDVNQAKISGPAWDQCITKFCKMVYKYYYILELYSLEK